MSGFKAELESDKNASLVSEIIKDRLYFVTYKTKTHRTIPETHYFTTDEEFTYNNYYNDFGPVNIAAVYRFNQKLNFKLKTVPLLTKKIVLFTCLSPQKRSNAAFLIGTYCIAYLNMVPRETFDLLSSIKYPYLSFQDASPMEAIYTIRLIDCLNAFKKALFFGLINLDDFDLEAYEKNEKMYGGDMTWIIPQKMLAFSSPVENPPDRTYHAPRFYVDYFQKNNIKAVFRLNLKLYDANGFVEEGIAHYDMFFQDGGTPTSDILERFLQLSESSSSAVAVHCKAGLGRTGCLIGAYLLKHYRMSALEAIAWMRICRPGCIIGSQQTWLEDIEPSMWSAGDLYRMRFHGGTDILAHHKRGIYSRKPQSDEKASGRPNFASRPSSQCINIPQKSVFTSMGHERNAFQSESLSGDPNEPSAAEGRAMRRKMSRTVSSNARKILMKRK